MFEQKIEEVKQRLIDGTIGTRATISLRQIEEAPIPNALKHFFNLDCDKWVEEERERLLRAPHFDYSDEEIVKMFSSFVVSSKLNATFARDEFIEALDKHAKLLFNHACRPQYTLLKFIFAGGEIATAEHIVKAMKYFLDYEYYQLLVEEYIAAKNIQSMTKEKFENLLIAVDNELIRNFDSWKLAHLTNPIFLLFNYGDELTEIPVVPIEALTIFYADKNCSEIVERLDEEKDHRPVISMHDLSMILGESDYSMSTDIGALFNRHADKVTSNIIPPSIERQQEGQQTKPDIQTMLDSLIENAFTDVPAIESINHISNNQAVAGSGAEEADSKEAKTMDERIEANSSFENELIEGMEQVNPVQPELRLNDGLNLFEVESEVSIPADANPDAFSDSEDFFKEDESKFIITVEDSIPDIELHVEKKELPVLNIAGEEHHRLQEEVAGEKYPQGDDETKIVVSTTDLRSSIAGKNRKKYIKKIFKKNEQSYENAIELLNKTNTWREASAYLDEIFLKNDIDMYSRIAVKFTDEIYQRYLPQS